jgi:hypothetical protein
MTKHRHHGRIESTGEGNLEAIKGVSAMCDYSLHHVASRPAVLKDTLVTTRFGNSITRGFAAVGEPNVAVCLLPGTELAFESNVECQPAFGLFPSKKIGHKLARFRQVNLDDPNAHHDALEFPDGQVVLVTRLRPGQIASVLQMPATVRAGIPEVVEVRRGPAPERVW